MPLISEYDLQVIQRMIEEGATYQAIALHLGISSSYVGKICKRNGWKSRFAWRQELNAILYLDNQKQCATCEQIKSTDDFDLDTRAIGGYSSQCKKCRSPIINRWQKSNYQNVLMASRKWKKNNREHVQAYSSRYHQDHKEERNAYLRGWYRRNPGMYKIYRQQRDARERGAAGSFTPEQLQARIDFYGGRCYLCGCNWYLLPKEDQTIDHVIPLIQGGSQWPANLRPACRSCNSSKGRSNISGLSTGASVTWSL